MSGLRLLVVVMSALVAPLFLHGCGGGGDTETEDSDMGGDTDTDM